MSNRLDLHNLLLSVGCKNVYYQIPSNVVMQYPCIKYEKDRINNNHASNRVYKQDIRYSITVISKSADDKLVDIVSKIPHINFDRTFIADNLYHTVFNLFF